MSGLGAAKPDAFAVTRAAYASLEGAAAYLLKEQIHEAARNAWAWELWEGVDLNGARILDLGCAFGRDVMELRRRGAEAIGVDASPALLAEARRLSGHPEWWVEADVLTLREPPVALAGKGGLDGVWCYALLVHVPRVEVPGLFHRWASWLRPGGVLWLATQLGEGEQLVTNMGGLPRQMVLHTLPELMAMAKAAGFEVEMAREKPIGAHTNPLGQLRLRKLVV